MVKDKSYQLYPLGMEVAKFLRAKRLEGASQKTLESYETTLRLFVLDHRDIVELEEFARPENDGLPTDFLLERWGDSAPATIDNRTGALNSFFAWAYDSRRVSRLIRVKRRRGKGVKLRVPHELDEIRFIAGQQIDVEDELAILLMGRLGFRKMDVGHFQARDVDIAHDVVYIRLGKGVKPVELPITFDDVREALKLWTAKASSPDEYLWHPKRDRLRAPDPSSVHRRFKRCLERAGVPDFPMHELRHSAGDRLWRKTGDIMLASQLLRHSSLETTRRYLHPTQDDLRAAMRASDE